MTSHYPAPPSGAQGTVTNLTTTTSSAALGVNFGAQTRQILMTASTATFVLIQNGSTAASATNGTLLGTMFPYYFKVNPGETLTAIAQTTGGVLSVTELAT